MKRSEIEIDDYYIAMVDNILTTVRVNRIWIDYHPEQKYPSGHLKKRKSPYTVYDVTDCRTNQKIVFRSTLKFRAKTNLNQERSDERV